ncbi:MAG: hypothetical protein SFX73_34080 [Kofleriaceae bacterium]|nr:hypothetical protein [Kofleriaceae bacterium]
MKKCASCTKDLPDAALHCVFCGAKQAPAPAVPAAAANAKTVMGYGGAELEALRAQAVAANAARAAGGAPPSNLPSAAPYSAPKPAPLPAPQPDDAADMATVLEPGVTPFVPAPAPAYSPPAAAPAPYTPPAPAYTPPAPAPAPYTPPPAYTPPAPSYSPPASSGGYNPPGGGYNPQPVQPVQPIQAAQPPYLASQTAARAGRPIEPWKDTIRVQMFIWGALLLLAFVAPSRLDPMTFGWDGIIHGAGKQKLGPLLIASIGLLSIVIGSISMESAARGALAAVLGLAGILVPLFVLGGAMPHWTTLVSVLGLVLLVPSLLARNEYRDAPLPRVLVTIGVAAVLLPLLLPKGGNIPLVGMFQAVLDRPGQYKIMALADLLLVIVVAMSLLAWLPSPASGASKTIAWAILVWPAVHMVSGLFTEVGADPTKNPASILTWLVGSDGVGAGFLAIASYGIATILGKQLE